MSDYKFHTRIDNFAQDAHNRLKTLVVRLFGGVRIDHADGGAALPRGPRAKKLRQRFGARPRIARIAPLWIWQRGGEKRRLLARQLIRWLAEMMLRRCLRPEYARRPFHDVEVKSPSAVACRARNRGNRRAGSRKACEGWRASPEEEVFRRLHGDGAAAALRLAVHRRDSGLIERLPIHAVMLAKRPSSDVTTCATRLGEILSRSRHS